jgi:hypothetical protein
MNAKLTKLENTMSQRNEELETETANAAEIDDST